MSFHSKLTKEEILEKSKKYSLYTWVAQKDASSIAVERGDGVYFWDYDGTKYFDMNAQQVNNNIGFNNQKVIKAIQQQAEKLCYVSPRYTTDVRALLAEKIIKDIAPDYMKKVMFTLGGADANEYAIRMCKAFTGKAKIFSQHDSYHGSTYGACNLTGAKKRGSANPQIAGFVKFLGPNWDIKTEFPDEASRATFYVKMLRDQIIREGVEDVAGIFFETITGSGGAIIPPKGYYEGVRKICDEFGILMVCDEIMVGFGRTGKWFACENFNFKPDIITFAKGVTCGYVPLGGVLVTQEIADFFENTALPCGLTYNSHALACAAALATIEVYEEEKLLERAVEMGKYLSARLDEIKAAHPSVYDVRCLGLMSAFELQPSIKSPELFNTVLDKLKKEKCTTFGYDCSFLIAPPLTVTKDELEEGLRAVNKVLDYTDTLL